MSEICTACDVRGFTTCKIDCLCSYGNPMIPTRAEAERPKVELNPYTFSEACAIYEKLLGEKFELERKLRAALTEIADFKAMLGTDQIERLKARLQK